MVIQDDGTDREFINLPDGKVHYELAGSADNNLVVLIPGYFDPLTMWDDLFIDLLKSGFSVLRYDLYGWGLSARPDSVYNRRLYDRQLYSLLESLNIKGNIILVGFSMGGMVAIHFAASHPQIVRGLCLISPAGILENNLQSMLIRCITIPGLGEWVFGLLNEKSMMFLLNFIKSQPNLITNYAPKLMDQMKEPGYSRALLSAARVMLNEDLTNEYHQIGELDIPVLLIWGENDVVAPFKNHKFVLSMIPQGEMHTVMDAGHNLLIECPELVNPIIINFFKCNFA